MKSIIASGIGVLALLCMMQTANAQTASKKDTENEKVYTKPLTGFIYAGLGQKDDETPTEAGGHPWSIGYVSSLGDYPDSEAGSVLGIDFAQEGSFLDSTYGNDTLKKATSLNLLYGYSWPLQKNSRLYAAALLGLRSSFSDCPDSYLGYQCYADRSPDTEYDLNYGAVMGIRWKRTVLGLRGTGESVQGLIGFAF